MLNSVLQMLALGVLAVATPLQAAVRPENEQSITVGTSYTIASDILANGRQVNVWLPDGHATSGKRYPVVYFLDGATNQDCQKRAPACQWQRRVGDLATFAPRPLAHDSRTRRDRHVGSITDSRSSTLPVVQAVYSLLLA